MNGNTKTGLRILQSAVLLGVCGDVLMRVTWGINFALLTWALIVALFAVARYEQSVRRETATDEPHGGERLTHCARRWLLPSTALFALCMAWRDAEMLQVLNVFAVTLLLSLVMMESRRGRVVVAGVMQCVGAYIRTALTAIGGGLRLVFGDIAWREVRSGVADDNGWTRHAIAVVRGVVLVAPLLIIFLGLFMAADAVFNRLVTEVFGFDAETPMSHLLLAGAFAWLTAGYLRGVMFGDIFHTTTAVMLPVKANTTADNTSSQAWRLGTIEIMIVLGALNLLFATFVVVQIRYLFGGARRVAEVAGLTVSEYARGGFFELVWVTGLVLALVLTTHRFLRAGALTAKIFRCLASSLVALVFIIMASALKRMMLYQNEYGLTALRVYTTAFMLWLGVMLAWFLWTVIVRNQRERFAAGALASGLCMLLILHVVNPDALIARTNLARDERRVFDIDYAVWSLSADAVPVLWRNSSHLNDATRAILARNLLTEKEHLDNLDWRSWSVARHQARKTIARHESEMRALIATVE